MADFKIAYKRTLKVEGGYQCDADDNGNWTGGKKGSGVLVGTNFGITAPELMSHLKRVPSVNDMRYMPESLAEEIYKANYWAPIKGDSINSQDIANDLFDMGVNGGVGTAIMLAHRSAGLSESYHMTNELLNHLNNVS